MAKSIRFQKDFMRNQLRRRRRRRFEKPIAEHRLRTTRSVRCREQRASRLRRSRAAGRRQCCRQGDAACAGGRRHDWRTCRRYERPCSRDGSVCRNTDRRPSTSRES